MLRFYRSTVGKKILMAVSGIIGVLFLILHMLGNLQIFQGAAKINGYGAILHGPLQEVVLAQRVVLIVAVLVHVLMAYQLTMRARAARPAGYVQRKTQAAIKIFQTQLPACDQKKFLAEVKCLQELEHPHIVHILEA